MRKSVLEVVRVDETKAFKHKTTMLLEAEDKLSAWTDDMYMPFGLKIEVNLGVTSKLVIRGDKTNFVNEQEEDGTERYRVSFDFEADTYEVVVYLTKDKKSVKRCLLYHWTSSGHFEEGLYADDVFGGSNGLKWEKV